MFRSDLPFICRFSDVNERRDEEIFQSSFICSQLLSDLNANTYKHRITSAQHLLYGTASQDKHQDGLFMGLVLICCLLRTKV